MLSEDPSQTPVSEAGLASILRWYVEMGVDVAVGDMPRDYFAEGAAKAAASDAAPPAEAPAPVAETDPDAPRAQRTAPRLGPPAALPVRSVSGNGSVSPRDALETARELAAGAQDLNALRAAMQAFEGCALKRTASQMVFGDGNPAAKIMLIGDAPGAQEDRQGVPFVGPDGQMLDRMLAAIGLDRTKVYLANVLPWRPPGKRPLNSPEVVVCLPFIQRQIALVSPEVIVCLGDVATQALLGVRESIPRARGKWFEYREEVPDKDSRPIPAMAMFHPTYLLKAPVNKRYAWQDMRALRKALFKKGLC
ncbi:MAG: phage polymerase-related protein [Hyphomicrobiales bacterium]|nr:phage polymerase-related protein [Hyphomicrobiales bacterium]